MIIEVVVYNMESAYKAQQAGADRVEVCDNPAEGGTTPSYGTIELIRQHLNLDVFVMIRPRGGDFLYSFEEYHIMKKDIEMCKRLSVDGVVFGILNADGTLDKKRCKKLIDAARPLQVTCHRAFDKTNDPLQALEDCIEVGFNRILTSGQQQHALQGIALITELVKRAGERIVILPGSGIQEESAYKIVSQSGVKELHLSAKMFRRSEMLFQNHVTMGSDDTETVVRTINPEIIRKIRAFSFEK
jgi:copper homeostasis protein